MPDMLIELRNTTRLYRTVIGVNDITLSLPPGAYGLLGPNGAGKSTLLQLLTGQLRPTLGEVRILGRIPRNDREFLSKIGYLPGSEGVYPDVSAIDWVAYLTELHGYGRAEARHLAERALSQVGLTEHMHRDIAEYSRGMRQRTRLAQAIAHRPELLILDEPFNGLDPIARHEMTQLLRQWISEGCSLVLASHVLHEIESITRSFMLISGGRLLASGSADDIHELLADVPSEISLTTNKPRELAAALLQAQLVDSVRIGGEASLSVTTRASLKFYEFLRAEIASNGTLVSEMHSADESLQEVFNALMRVHRGEL